jgi:DNA-directed RNA polymerase specialized sigma24 family protein
MRTLQATAWTEEAVEDNDLDQALPGIRKLAKLKAHAFIRRCGLAIQEREDIESQLVLTFLARLPKFDGERASVQTFASRLMDKELISILRYRLAHCRRPRELPAVEVGPCSASRHQFRIDFERAIAPLPKKVRLTASTLFLFSDVETAKAAKCSRQVISRRKHQIRDALVATGMTADYFAGGRVRT